MGLEVQRSQGGKITILILDAANAMKSILSTTFLIWQIFQNAGKLDDLKILHIASTTPIERDGHYCAVFAWDHLRWSREQPDLFEELSAMQVSVDQARHQKIARAVIEQHFPAQMQLPLSRTLPFFQWIDYEYLRDPRYTGFFLNMQSEVPGFLGHIKPLIEKWQIEKPNPEEKWVLHNIRILYIAACMRAMLNDVVVPQEYDFIVQHMVDTCGREGATVGLTLRMAACYGFPARVQRLLELSDVDVNEISASKQTAMDRARACAVSAVKQEIIDLLASKDAKTAAELAMRPSEMVDTTFGAVGSSASAVASASPAA